MTGVQVGGNTLTVRIQKQADMLSAEVKHQAHERNDHAPASRGARQYHKFIETIAYLATNSAALERVRRSASETGSRSSSFRDVSAMFE